MKTQPLRPGPTPKSRWSKLLSAKQWRRGQGEEELFCDGPNLASANETTLSRSCVAGEGALRGSAPASGNLALLCAIIVTPALLLVLLGDAALTARSQTPAASRVAITIEGTNRVIRANGLPDHPAGAFPNANNPNSIAPQNYTFRVPLHPQPAASPVPVGMQNFGIALNGVVFDPAANEFWNGDRSSGWQYEAMSLDGKLGIDQNNAHVQPNGAYHYHGIPFGLLASLKGTKDHMTLLGWAADGFPIYAPAAYTDPKNTNSPLKEMTPGYRLKKGTRPTGPGGAYDGAFTADYEYVAGAGDLDDCNGRTGVTPEFPEGTYYYCVTAAYPYLPRLYRGTPDPSFERRGPPRGGRDGRGGPGGPGDGRGPRRGPPRGPGF